MGAELHLDRFERGRAHGQRTLDVGRATGQGFLLPALLPALGACYELLGRLDESAALLEGGIEAARLSGNRAGAVAGADEPLDDRHRGGRRRDSRWRCGEEALERARSGRQRRCRSRSRASRSCARCCSRASRARALELLLAGGGGEELPRMPGAWRRRRLRAAHALPARRSDARSKRPGGRRPLRAARRAEVGLRYAAGAGRPRARRRSRWRRASPAVAAEQALAAAAGFEALAAPIHAAPGPRPRRPRARRRRRSRRRDRPVRARRRDLRGLRRPAAARRGRARAAPARPHRLPPQRGERARVADRARARDRPPGRRPPDEHADRRGPLPVQEDGRDAPAQHLRQGRRVIPRGARPRGRARDRGA